MCQPAPSAAGPLAVAAPVGPAQKEVTPSAVGVNDLPTELLARIILTVGRRSVRFLCKASEVCRLWYTLANDDFIWSEMCKKRWAGKNMPLVLHPKADYKLCANTLSVRELKELLRLRHEDTRQVFEKSDLIQQLHRSTPDRLPYPQRGKWKASYVAAEIDSKRDIITKEELCSIEFNMVYKQMKQDNARSHNLMLSRFFPDFTYVSESLLDKAQWRFYGAKNLIGVDEYPLLHAIRTKDWGWEFHNDFVILQTHRVLTPAEAASPFVRGRDRNAASSSSSATATPAPAPQSFASPASAAPSSVPPSSFLSNPPRSGHEVRVESMQ